MDVILLEKQEQGRAEGRYTCIANNGWSQVSHNALLTLPQTALGKLLPLSNNYIPRQCQEIYSALTWQATITGMFLYIYLFGVLRRFQHCTGHITTGSRKGRGNQYIEFVRVLYCKLPTNGKQLPAVPLEAMMGIELNELEPTWIFTFYSQTYPR